MMMKISVIVTLLVETALCDVYMHNPRGSNDRNCERNVNRDNGDRLFNSQNNNAGGYACPRPVGSEGMMNEAGDYTWTETNTGKSVTYTQNLKMYYYETSILPIEFTNQHGCGGNSKLSCEVILQYACEDTLDPQIDNFYPWTAGKSGATNVNKQHFRKDVNNIAAPRDGVPTSADDAATSTINDDEASAIPTTPATRRYGMHESYDYYQVCQHTERNKGLYTADQQVRRDDQRGTRQNPNGNRNGLECPEERDYYPWWQPSPWIDIAVLSDSADDMPCWQNSAVCTKRCVYYMNNTMNIAIKGYCDVDHDTGNVNTKLNHQLWSQRKWPNNKAACTALGSGFKWYSVSHADNLDYYTDANLFVCAKTQYSRANQLGNARADTIFSGAESGLAHAAVTKSVNANRFLWTVPKLPTPKTPSKYFTAGMESAYKSCTLRIRYNISTGDFQQWPDKAVNVGTAPMVDYRNNSQSETDTRTPVHQNPYVYIGPGQKDANGLILGEEFVKLKINTNQYGRTFQDRSYTFTIKPLPTSTVASDSPRVEANNKLDTPLVSNKLIFDNIIAGNRIYNVNVRGKRGNIVQTYPSVEYDFVPNQLALSQGDMIHFQWTGSDYNPRRGCNDGAGGPPDANTFSTSANADQNSRADRHNVVLNDYMSKYTPADYLGYNRADSTLTYDSKNTQHEATLLAKAFCNNGASTGTAGNSYYTQDDCFNTMMRLAHLNQQNDGASLFLRNDAKCYTTTQLAALNNNDVADNHPLNCAKLNAKKAPYFDAGVVPIHKDGWFSYFDTRNNNFSNRMTIAILCVGADCQVVNGTNVLQMPNPDTNGDALTNNEASHCQDTGSQPGQSVNGVQACIGTNGNFVLSGETLAGNEGDNDNKGDGTSTAGCAELTYIFTSPTTIQRQVILAVILFFIGLILAWGSYYLYNRYQASQSGVSKFRFDASWQANDNKEMAASAPKANNFDSNIKKQHNDLI